MLNDKIVFITGADRGIGRAIAIEMGKAGATLVGFTKDAKDVADIESYLREMKFKGQGFAMDVSNSKEVESVIAEAIKSFGAPNILVNNAGITADNLLMRMSDDEWQRVLNTNLNSVFYLSKICVRHMLKARWGRIINLASMVGVSGNPGQTNYCSAKAGVIGFTKSLALEIASRGITVNAIAPGYIETGMTGKLTEEQRSEMLKRIPLGRAGRPEDIAHAALFLASEGASYITGATIHVNGGLFIA
jgi:3-oxoacyl-[acyl-carrier protein] reductase